MGQRTEGLRDMISKNYDDIRSLFERLSEADLDKNTDNGWTVRKLAGHIAGAPGGAIYITKRLAAGKSATVPGFLAFALSLRNWLGVRRFSKATKADLLRAWESGHNELFAFMTTLTDEQLDKGGTVMGMGEHTAYSFLAKGVAQHAQEHANDIRKAIGPAVMPA